MAQQPSWSKAKVEPEIGDLLGDPIARALMAADHISRQDVLTLVQRWRESSSRTPFSRPSGDGRGVSQGRASERAGLAPTQSSHRGESP